MNYFDRSNLNYYENKTTLVGHNGRYNHKDFPIHTLLDNYFIHLDDVGYVYTTNKITMQFTLLQHGENIQNDHWIYVEVEDFSWKEWYDEIMRRHKEGGKTYDVDECQECGVIGIEHLQECLNFLSK